LELILDKIEVSKINPKSSNMKTAWIALFCTAVFLTGCKKEIDLPDSSLKSIFGKWEWLETDEANANIISPASAGYNQSFEFQKNGVFRRYRNGDQKDRGKYYINQELSILNVGAYIIHFKNATYSDFTDSPSRVSIVGDTLKLAEERVDGSTHVFLRK
jgi:hypothetical protein